MQNANKMALVGIVLTLLPVIAVRAVEQSSLGPVLATPTSRQLGSPKASIVVVEYSDFQCPSCANAQPTLHKLLDVYKGKIRLAYKYFPLRQHKNAIPAAHTAECAAQQQKFWPVEDALFSHQKEWAELQDPTTFFAQLAVNAQVDKAKFDACMADANGLAPIMQDKAEGESEQVKATPTFFIGKERLVGAMIDSDGARVIEQELRKK